MPKQEAGTDAGEASTLKRDEGAPTTPASSIKAQREIKEERESPREESRIPLPAQSSHASIPESRRPYEPERNCSRWNASSPPKLEVPLIDLLNELRIVQHECRQLKTQVENVVPTESGDWDARQGSMKSLPDKMR